MMSEADFPQAMTPKEPRLVNIAIDTDDTSLARVLPHRDVTFICQYGFLVEIQSNHQLVIVEFAYEMPVIEISERIHQRFLAIGMLHHTEERQACSTIRRNVNSESQNWSTCRPPSVSTSIIGIRSCSPGRHWAVKLSSCFCKGVCGRKK